MQPYSTPTNASKPGRSRRLITRKLLVVGFGCLFLGLLALVLIAFTFYGIFHRELPMPGWVIPTDDVQTIRKTCALESDEDIIYFFALDFFTNMEDGSFFTNKRVVHYPNGKDPETVEHARYEEIEDIHFDNEYEWYNQAKIVIKRKDGTTFYLLLLKTVGGHQWFYDRLIKEWKSH